MPLTVPLLSVLLVPFTVNPPVLRVPELLIVFPPPFNVTAPLIVPVPFKDVAPAVKLSVPVRVPLMVKAEPAA